MRNAAVEFARNVLNSGILRDIAAIVASNLLNPAQATVEAIALVRTRANQLAGGAMSNVAMMGLSNLTMAEANDGLVPVSSVALPGADVVPLAPDADHAAPVMEVTPFRNFWSESRRNEATSGLVDSIRGGTPVEA